MDKFKYIIVFLFTFLSLRDFYLDNRPILTKLLIKKILKVFIKKRENVKNEDWNIIEPNLNRNLSKKVVYYLIPGNFKYLLKQSENKQLIDLKLNTESILFLFMNRFIRAIDVSLCGMFNGQTVGGSALQLVPPRPERWG